MKTLFNKPSLAEGGLALKEISQALSLGGYSTMIVTLNQHQILEQIEPPDPDDYPTLEAYEQAFSEWEDLTGDSSISDRYRQRIDALSKFLDRHSYVTKKRKTPTDSEFQPLHKIRSEIRQLTGSQQIELRDWLNELLSDDEDDWLPKTSARREVVKTERQGSTVYQLEKVRCGKNCQKCPHGPYWYSYTRVNGKIKSKYVGKSR